MLGCNSNIWACPCFAPLRKLRGSPALWRARGRALVSLSSLRLAKGNEDLRSSPIRATILPSLVPRSAHAITGPRDWPLHPNSCGVIAALLRIVMLIATEQARPASWAIITPTLRPTEDARSSLGNYRRRSPARWDVEGGEVHGSPEMPTVVERRGLICPPFGRAGSLICSPFGRARFPPLCPKPVRAVRSAVRPAGGRRTGRQRVVPLQDRASPS